MKPQITFSFPPSGGLKIEVAGTTGKACEAITRPFEEQLGPVSGRELKPEYHRPGPVQQTVRAESKQ